MLKALGPPAQPWYSPDFFKSQAARDKVIANAHGKVYVVYDTYTKKDCDKGICDASFLSGGGYHVVYRSQAGTYTLYEVDGR